jgi:archaemetzincin
MLKRYIFLLMILACIIFPNENKASPMENTGIIVPIGDIDTKLLQELAETLSDRFPITFTVGKPMEIPEGAYNSRRNQYHSTTILDDLAERYDNEKVLGVIDKDLYVPELNFVFGEADLSGRVCIISITRLRQEYYGLPEDEKVFRERVVKEAVHELGHTYGLGHCSNPKCVMFFSNSLLDTDRKSSEFCEKCQRKL